MIEKYKARQDMTTKVFVYMCVHVCIHFYRCMYIYAHLNIWEEEDAIEKFEVQEDTTKQVVYMYICMHICVWMYVYISFSLSVRRRMRLRSTRRERDPPTNGEIALWPNIRVAQCKFIFHERQTGTIIRAIGTATDCLEILRVSFPDVSGERASLIKRYRCVVGCSEAPTLGAHKRHAMWRARHRKLCKIIRGKRA